MEQRDISFDLRLDRVIAGFVDESYQRPSGKEIARKAAYSTAQTHRLFRERFGESPGALRRRLVLERAADLLKRSDDPVWKIAVQCGFESAEAFSRAFRRAFGIAPSGYRGQATGGPSWLPAPSKVHYWRGSLLRTMNTGGRSMTLVDRLIEHDLSDTRRLLDRAQLLTDDQLDAPLPNPTPRLFLECFESTLRGRLDYVVLTKEVWLAAVYARQSPLSSDSAGTVGGRDQSREGLLARWNAVEPEWRELVRSVEGEARWDEMFIDALCEQPETFSFGGMVAHVLDQSSRQRAEIFRAFTALGHADACDGDPLAWERKRAS